MFDWFWEFLYSLSKTLLKGCDWLMEVSMKLIGIQPITVEGESTDFLTYLIKSAQVTKAYKTAFSLGIIILFLFTILSIILNIVKDGQHNMTPGQIVVKALKAFFGFLLVPTVMIVLVAFLNTFMKGLYEATSASGSSVGSFLFTVFAQNAGLDEVEKAGFLKNAAGYDYYVLDNVTRCITLKEFEFLFSWIVGGFVFHNLISSLVLFIERAISIIILYIAAPFSIGSTVLDDGNHFKNWREQVLTKFLTAYGTVIAINIYILITGFVVKDTVVFFEDSTLNFVCKVLITLGGALSMRKGALLISTLLSPGSFHDTADSLSTGRALTGGLASAAKKSAIFGAKAGMKAAAAPFKATRAAWNFGKDASKNGLGNTIANRLGFKTDKDYEKGGGTPTTTEGTPNPENPEFDPNQEDLLKKALGQKKPETTNQQINPNINNGKPDLNVTNNPVINAIKKGTK